MTKEGWLVERKKKKEDRARPRVVVSRPRDPLRTSASFLSELRFPSAGPKQGDGAGIEEKASRMQAACSRTQCTIGSRSDTMHLCLTLFAYVRW